MEEFRRNRLNELIVIIQTKFRSYIQRKRYLCLKNSQTVISRAWRAWRVSLHLNKHSFNLTLQLKDPQFDSYTFLLRFKKKTNSYTHYVMFA